MGNTQVHPSLGTVAFGSGLHGWAFTLTHFARIYSEKFKVEESILMKKLWGESYYDNKEKKWRTTSETEDGRILERGFCTFIMKPIITLTRNIMDNNKEQVWRMLKALGVEIKEAEKEKIGKELLKLVF
jgi:elongation factor 2